MKREQLVGAEKHKDMEECVLQEKYHHVMQLVYQGLELQLPILPIGNWIAGLEKPTHRVSYTKKQLQKIENIKNEIYLKYRISRLILENNYYKLSQSYAFLEIYYANACISNYNCFVRSTILYCY